MARGRKKTKAVLRLQHNKDTLVQVGLDDEQTKLVDALVERELPERIKAEPRFGRATVIREHAMEGIRRKLGESADAPDGDRRSGERRAALANR